MAQGWKRGGEWLLARSGIPGALSRRIRPATAILAYHNIVPHGQRLAGDASLHVDQAVFADQLDFLLDSYEVVPLECVRETHPDRDDTSRIVITFDDAYQGAMSVGLDEVRSRGLTATVFVPPGLLGNYGFWWDRLAPRNGGSLEAAIRYHALHYLQGRQDRVMDWAAAQKLPVAELPAYARPVDEEMLFRRAADAGVRLGTHTWSHIHLGIATVQEVRWELETSRAWLTSRTSAFSDWLAYPYGLRGDRAVAEASRMFDGAVLADGGLAQVRGHWRMGTHLTPRLNVPRGLTLKGLALRLAGLLL